jgi:hypothetical protein
MRAEDFYETGGGGGGALFDGEDQPVAATVASSTVTPVAVQSLGTSFSWTKVVVVVVLVGLAVWAYRRFA